MWNEIFPLLPEEPPETGAAPEPGREGERQDASLLSWGENPAADGIRRVSDLIVAALTGPLGPALPGRGRSFFIVPAPSPYAKAEAEFVRAGGAGLRGVTLPKGGRCYAVSGEEGFRALLPQAFRLGPPELTFIAAHFDFGPSTPEDEIAAFVGRALVRLPSSTTPRDIVGLHFDRGISSSGSERTAGSAFPIRRLV